MSSPKVSVCIITYNHGRYIRQAIDSVLRQQTTFPVEIIIGEDCSTDGTRKIVEEYSRLYPTQIRPLLRDMNVGMMRNFGESYHACQGEYVSLLEGDDYWTDSEKLQRQVDLMEANPELSLCFHAAQYVDESGYSLGWRHPQECPSTIGIDEIIRRNYVQTCTAMVRRSSVPRLPAYFEQLKLGDWPLCILAAQEGRLGYIDAEMASYRVHRGGVWSGASGEVKDAAVIDMYLHILRSNPELHALVREAIVEERERAFLGLRESLAVHRSSWTWRVGSVVTWPARIAYRSVSHWIPSLSRAKG